MKILQRFFVVIFLVSLAAVAGCGTKETLPPVASAAEGLQELPEVYRYRTHEQLPPPSRPEDLAEYADALPNAWPRIQNGDYIVYWRVGLSDAGPGANAILAYEKKTPTDGGAVLLRNGTVKEMTAAEFQAAPKAGR